MTNSNVLREFSGFRIHHSAGHLGAQPYSREVDGAYQAAPHGCLPHDTYLREPEEIHAQTVARDLLRDAAENESLELAVSLFTAPLTELRTRLAEKCVGSERLSIMQWAHPSNEEDDAYLTRLAPGTPMESILRQAHRQVSYASVDTADAKLIFFYCHCGNTRRFKVSASIIFSRHYRANALNFSLYLECEDDFGQRTKWHDVAFSMHDDGQLRNIEDEKIEKVSEIAIRAEKWCHEPVHWHGCESVRGAIRLARFAATKSAMVPGTSGPLLPDRRS